MTIFDKILSSPIVFIPIFESFFPNKNYQKTWALIDNPNVSRKIYASIEDLIKNEKNILGCYQVKLDDFQVSTVNKKMSATGCRVPYHFSYDEIIQFIEIKVEGNVEHTNPYYIDKSLEERSLALG